MRHSYSIHGVTGVRVYTEERNGVRWIAIECKDAEGETFTIGAFAPRGSSHPQSIHFGEAEVSPDDGGRIWESGGV